VYPPALTGMRGSHPGSFEVAHQLRDGAVFADPIETGERYDLIVVGAGISGLAAAKFYRAAHAGRVLVLDNHDDAGGHAKRNEFTVERQTLVSYGGTESIEYPSQYSEVSRKLLADIGVDLARFHTAFPDVDHKALGLRATTFFDRETFGRDTLVTGSPYEPSDELLARAPLADDVRRALVALYRDKVDYWPGETSAQKKARLAKLSYAKFLVDIAKLPAAALPWFQTWTHSLYGVGIDAVPALDCWGLEFPGFAGLALSSDEPSPGMGRTPQLEMHEEANVQFVDGNATVARLLVRALVPAALPGTSMEDAVTARLHYARLDDANAPVRIRLSSTVVRVRERAGEVQVTYVRDGRVFAARAGACVLACWHTIIPYLAPDLPEAQRKALAYAVKVPLVYTNVAIRDWRAFQRLGTHSIHAPGGYHVSARLELHDARMQPAVIKLVRTPCSPGLPARQQHRLGRFELLQTSFADFETRIKDQLGRMLGAGGFEPERDIAAITVNRWSHGYAYEYNSLWDSGAEPCVLAREPFGRIVIANSDAGAYAYTDCAIDQAWRAIGELG
jgi:spermidine dehydrogenase